MIRRLFALMMLVAGSLVIAVPAHATKADCTPPNVSPVGHTNWARHVGYDQSPRRNELLLHPYAYVLADQYVSSYFTNVTSDRVQVCVGYYWSDEWGGGYYDLVVPLEIVYEQPGSGSGVTAGVGLGWQTDNGVDPWVGISNMLYVRYDVGSHKECVGLFSELTDPATSVEKCPIPIP